LASAHQDEAGQEKKGPNLPSIMHRRAAIIGRFRPPFAAPYRGDFLNAEDHCKGKVYRAITVIGTSALPASG